MKRTCTVLKLCKIDGCKREAKVKDLCQSHYARFIKFGDASIGGPIRSKSPRDGKCSVDGCKGDIYAKKMCQKHHRRWIRHNNPNHTSYKRNKGNDCQVKNCGQEARSKGYCSKHYAKFYRLNRKEKLVQTNTL